MTIASNHLKISPPAKLLLINVGSPDKPNRHSVKRFLTEFLTDPKVITFSSRIPSWMQWILRNALVRFLIIPLRLGKVVHAYQSIWTSNGSPFHHYSKGFGQLLAKHLSQSAPDLKIQVKVCNRYGLPALLPELKEIRPDEKIIIAPMFPQWAHATTGTILDYVKEQVTHSSGPKHGYWLKPFFHWPEFQTYFAVKMAEHPEVTHWLITFHGLPESQVIVQCENHCLKKADCCDSPPGNCYRSQCLKTAQSIAKLAKLDLEHVYVSFQSRLGRTKWIGPYTEDLLAELGKRGIPHLGVISPSFVVDCLETLEELGVRGREIFKTSGGGNFTLVECPNLDPNWVRAFCERITRFSASDVERIEFSN